MVRFLLDQVTNNLGYCMPNDCKVRIKKNNRKETWRWKIQNNSVIFFATFSTKIKSFQLKLADSKIRNR